MNDHAIARHLWAVAAGMVAVRDPDAADLAAAALTHPSPMTIRALLEAGRGRPWRQSILEALAEVGIAAAAQILGDNDE